MLGGAGRQRPLPPIPGTTRRLSVATTPGAVRGRRQAGIRSPGGVRGAQCARIPARAAGSPARVVLTTPSATTSAQPTTTTTAAGQAPQAAAKFSFVGPVRAAILASQAYIYGYPLMEYERVRQTVPDLNTIYSLTSFANPDVAPIWTAIGGGKRPNTDTFYSLAELDLSNGPVVLSIPDMGTRYYSFQLTDPYTNVVDYIGSRTTASDPGQYAITWTGGP